MSNFLRILKSIGRALLRAIFAVGRFFKLLFKKIGKAFKTNKQKKIIRKSEKKIDALYVEIGRNYFEAHAADPEPLLAELCADVSENNAAVLGATDKIQSLKDEYVEAKAAAKEKGKARRAADKAKARAEKDAAGGIVPDEPAVEAPLPVSEPAPVFTAPVEPEPAPVFTAPVEPEPVAAPAPVFEPAPAEEAPAPEFPAEPAEPAVETPAADEPIPVA